MRIALLNPVYSAHDAGDSERRTRLLGRALAARGHEITLLTSGPGTSQEEDGVTVVRSRRPPALRVQRFYEDHLERVPGLVVRLLGGSFDIAHACAPADAWAATLARGLSGPPLVYSFHGSLTRRWLVSRHYRLEMMRATAAAAGECIVESAAAADAFERYLLRKPLVMPHASAEDYEAIYGSFARAGCESGVIARQTKLPGCASP